MKKLLLLLGVVALGGIVWSCGGDAAKGKTNKYLGDIPALVQSYEAEQVAIEQSGEEFLEKNKNSTDVTLFTKYAEEVRVREETAEQTLNDGLAKARETLIGVELPFENQDPLYTVSALKITDIDSNGTISAEGTLTVNELIPLSNGTAYVAYQLMDNAGVPIQADGLSIIQNPDYKVQQAAAGEQFPVKVVLNAHKYPTMTNFDKVVFSPKK